MQLKIILNTFIFSLILFTITCCNGKLKNEDISDVREIYIIKSLDTKKEYNDTNTLTIVEFYLDYNILLVDSLKDIYYHKKRFYCLYGRDSFVRLPYFRNLQPEYFKKSKIVEEVINLILRDSIRPKRVYIACNQDTIVDERYFQMKKLFIKNNIAVSTRKLTEEESIVLNSILNKKEYKPENINWKRTLGVPEINVFNKKLEIVNEH